jgi:hypothetical protein
MVPVAWAWVKNRAQSGRACVSPAAKATEARMKVAVSFDIGVFTRRGSADWAVD